MPEQVPRNLEIITVLDFKDGDSHYLQSWNGQLHLKEGEIINLLGDLGISDCRPGKYKVHYDEPASQLNLNSEEPDVLRKFYSCIRLEE